MKNIFKQFLFLLLFSSCTPQFIQVFDTNSVNTKLSSGYYVFDNDTLQITYTFWASNGAMAFTIYNKLDKPIYIDWKNSSFIYNEKKLDYWVDAQQTNAESYYTGYYYKGELLRPDFAINEGRSHSVSKTVKPERITFIPPKSYCSHSQFNLIPGDYFKIDTKKMSSTVVQRNDKPKKKTTLYEQNFDLSNSPLNFRNYIAFSFSEIPSSFYFIDNGFYLTSVKEMDYRHFVGKETGSNNEGKPLFEKPFKKMTSFYINIAQINSVNYSLGYDNVIKPKHK